MSSTCYLRNCPTPWSRGLGGRPGLRDFGPTWPRFETGGEFWWLLWELWWFMVTYGEFIGIYGIYGDYTMRFMVIWWETIVLGHRYEPGWVQNLKMEGWKTAGCSRLADPGHPRPSCRFRAPCTFRKNPRDWPQKVEGFRFTNVNK